MPKETKPKETKSEGQKLQEKLFFNPVNCWEKTDDKTHKEIESFADAYKKFIDRGKTEREFTRESIALLEKKGFVNIEAPGAAAAGGKKLQPGAKVYRDIRGKALICAVVGKSPPGEGVNILGAHIDSPRIDMKQNPLYEESGLAFLDTHYYGGIKKYQWTAIPLAMHGVFISKKGQKHEISLGEDESDPVFTITDLLPHLAQEQMQKKASEFIDAEELDVLAGSIPYKDDKVKEKIKLNIMSMLNKKYGITEKDFASAEIEFVPAFKARDLGLDRSMIGAYGHDDRCCAYPSLRALIDSVAKTPPAKTMICYLSDKEEIGSVGNTGAQSYSFQSFIEHLCKDRKELTRCLENSSMLSTDVNAAFDPAYAGVFEKKNASHMGKGLVLTKYTGSRGKSGASDANAEFCAKVQALLDNAEIPWQFGEMGKVDKGGGGTIALYAANLGMDVIDAGVPVLSMHSPFEVISKIDLFTAYRGYMAFLKGM